MSGRAKRARPGVLSAMISVKLFYRNRGSTRGGESCSNGIAIYACIYWEAAGYPATRNASVRWKYMIFSM
jgi:hypothetical protein